MKLLIVEDEINLLLSLSHALREHGYLVDTAEDGHEGAFKMQSWDYDLILLDVMVPGLDGWEMLRLLRQIKKTPVLMLTARDATADKVRGLDAGADDYLTKPFDLVELLARVRALIRRDAGQAVSQIVINRVEVDLAAHLVRLDGITVDLTAREYAMVEFLALHRGKLVTRTRLYEHLFDENENTFSNLLDVHISHVRKKLGHDFIATRRGHGYSIP